MEKTIAILLSLITAVCLAACGNSTDQAERSSTENHATENTTGDDAKSSMEDDAQAPDEAESADPIWWGEAPRIVSTFVESYDFSGKTVVPFCTSGGSGVGFSATNLEKLTDGARWLEGHRLNGSDSRDAVMEWVNGLGLDFAEQP